MLKPSERGQGCKELFPQDDDEGAPCLVEDDLVLQDNGFLSKNEVLRSRVSRITERLRKRCPANTFGTGRGADRRDRWGCGAVRELGIVPVGPLREGVWVLPSLNQTSFAGRWELGLGHALQACTGLRS